MDASSAHSAEVELAATWFIAARAMFVASGRTPKSEEAAAGLYAQAILGISELACLESKQRDQMGVMTLVDCLAHVKRMNADLQEKIVTGVMMMAFADQRIDALEVRWASMLASAADMSPDDFQRSCASARVIATMLQPVDSTNTADVVEPG